MENVMEMKGFQELNGMEMMETEGGNPLLIPLVVGVVLLLTGCNGNNGEGLTVGEHSECTSDYCIFSGTAFESDCTKKK